ncbi:gamma-glutamyltransferase [Rhodopila sp.]|uniref:gamma-glutamyltransferase n=1 Tax=Rhodopila sp. TaxID=2480087 RepID=UPI003D138579
MIALKNALVVLVLLGFIGSGHAASLPAVESETGMVVSAQRLAAEAGVAILRQGGNAIDAAVAVGYAEAVVNPCCGNIGGGGFLTARLADGRNIAISFRETAPAAASRNMYLDSAGHPVHDASRYGWKAIAVPGTVLGLETALTKYGTLPRRTVMAAAIRLAHDGFVLSKADADILGKGERLLRQDAVAASQFLYPDGTAYQAGDILRQPDLAATLQAIADHGPAAFYTGHIPQAVEAASRAGGGIITAADFASYHVTETSPLTCTYRGNVILSTPPPSSGGASICEILNVLEGYDLRAMGFHAAGSVHVMAEAMRLAYFDRSTFLGDPAFIDNPLNRLLSKDYAARLRGQITGRATPSADLGPAEAPTREKPQTTHYSVIDKDGNAVAVTYTINGAFGAGVIAGDTGFLLNDEMDDFTLKPGVSNLYGLVQGAANAIAPGKRPLSSMAPTIVLKDGQVRMVLGSPGGSRIVTIVLETILNMIDYDMTPQEAVDAPRLHLQWLPDILYAERLALSPDARDALLRMGYRIEEQPNWGAVELIAMGAPPAPGTTPPGMDLVTGQRGTAKVFYGASDPRRPAGAAIAP